MEYAHAGPVHIRHLAADGYPGVAACAPLLIPPPPEGSPFPMMACPACQLLTRRGPVFTAMPVADGVSVTLAEQPDGSVRIDP